MTSTTLFDGGETKGVHALYTPEAYRALLTRKASYAEMRNDPALMDIIGNGTLTFVDVEEFKNGGNAARYHSGTTMFSKHLTSWIDVTPIGFDVPLVVPFISGDVQAYEKLLATTTFGPKPDLLVAIVASFTAPELTDEMMAQFMASQVQ